MLIFGKVILQTYIEFLRGKLEDSQTINHHGKALEVEGGRVVSVSEVGGVDAQADTITPVESLEK